MVKRNTGYLVNGINNRKSLISENKKLKEEIDLYHQEYGAILGEESSAINYVLTKNHQDNKEILEEMEEKDSEKINIVSSPDVVFSHSFMYCRRI